MADGKKKSDEHGEVAKAIVAKLPKAVRDTVEVVEGGGAYTLLKHGGRTVASVRAKNARVTMLHDGSVASTAGIAAAIAAAAETKRKADSEHRPSGSNGHQDQSRSPHPARVRTRKPRGSGASEMELGGLEPPTS